VSNGHKFEGNSKGAENSFNVLGGGPWQKERKEAILKRRKIQVLVGNASHLSAALQGSACQLLEQQARNPRSKIHVK
jgi:hypothetical protein